MVAPTVTVASVFAATGAASVALAAEASDDVGVDRVEFYDGETLIGTDAAAPFAVELPLSGYPTGTSSLYARAYDARGNMGVSGIASLFVQRRVGVRAAAVGGGASLVEGGTVARLPEAGAWVNIVMPADLVAGKYALDLSARAGQTGGSPDAGIELDGEPYATVGVTSAETNDITINSTLAELRPGSTIRVRMISGSLDGARDIHVSGLRLEPATSPPAAPAKGSGFKVEIVDSGFKFPGSIAFAPDGSLFVLQRGDVTYNDASKTITEVPNSSKLWRYDLRTGTRTEVTGVPSTKLSIGGSETFNGGALGLALDPDFATNHRLFICYHYQPPNTDVNDASARRNALASFVVSGDQLTGTKVLVDGIPGGNNHNGCRVAVGPDGKVYLTTGDANTESTTKLSQSKDSTAGKILRLNPDGSVPTDNPYGNLVWTLGHRNPQGLAFQPGTGTLWSTEHGAGTKDELNIINKGKNYGWPICEGDEPTCAVTGPGTYQPAIKEYFEYSTLALSDIAFYAGDAFAAWKGDILMATLKTRRLYRLELDGQSVLGEDTIIAGDEPENYGRVRDVAVGPDGFVYVSTDVTNPYFNTTSPDFRAPNPLGGLLLRVRPD